MLKEFINKWREYKKWYLQNHTGMGSGIPFFDDKFMSWLDEQEEEPMSDEQRRLANTTYGRLKPKSIYDLKEGDDYWLIKDGNKPLEFKVLSDYGWYKTDLEQGNCFLTEEEAEAELSKRKAIQRVKKWKYDQGIDECENEHNDKYRFTIVDDMGKFFVHTSSMGHQHYSPIGLFDEEHAQRCIKECEADLKIIFNI